LTFIAGATIFNFMVEYKLDATFAALADPTRRGMLASLAQGERSIGELAAPFAMSFAGASKHVRMLEKAGLIERRRAGRQIICRVRPRPLREADAWLRQWESLWIDSLDKLEALLSEGKQ